MSIINKRRVPIILEILPSPIDRRVWQEASILRDDGDEMSIILFSSDLTIMRLIVIVEEEIACIEKVFSRLVVAIAVNLTSDGWIILKYQPVGLAGKPSNIGENYLMLAEPGHTKGRENLHFPMTCPYHGFIR